MSNRLEALEDLNEECKRYTALMTDPQPGLATWNIAVQKCVRQMKLLTDFALPRKSNSKS